MEKDIGSDQFPPNEHYFGLVNVSVTLHKCETDIAIENFHSAMKMLFLQFGNTCYSNSVLQALYFCRPFREKVLEYKARNKRTKETLLTCLADLFYSIATQKKKVGSIAPKKFIARLRKEKGQCFEGCRFIFVVIHCHIFSFFLEEFDNYMQQDAHEFLNFLINHINEIILGEYLFVALRWHS